MIGDALRWSVVTLVTFGAGVFLYSEYQKSLPCVEPVRYSIGAIDPRFGISDQELRSALLEASDIWSRGIGRTLFQEASAGGVTVNLVYDEREEIARMGILIAKEQEAIDALRSAHDRERAEIDIEQTALTEDIARLNARGGAGQNQYRDILDRQKKLQEKIDRFNAAIDALNARVRVFNEHVASYNTQAGVAFRAGEYVSDQSGEEITIFVFIGDEQLVRVLSHELGHALGLDHNTDPRSIMYAETESGNLEPSETDLSDLRTLCSAVM